MPAPSVPRPPLARRRVELSPAPPFAPPPIFSTRDVSFTPPSTPPTPAVTSPMSLAGPVREHLLRCHAQWRALHHPSAASPLASPSLSAPSPQQPHVSAAHAFPSSAAHSPVIPPPPAPVLLPSIPVLPAPVLRVVSCAASASRSLLSTAPHASAAGWITTHVTALELPHSLAVGWDLFLVRWRGLFRGREGNEHCLYFPFCHPATLLSLSPSIVSLCAACTPLTPLCLCRFSCVVCSRLRLQHLMRPAVAPTPAVGRRCSAALHRTLQALVHRLHRRRGRRAAEEVMVVVAVAVAAEAGAEVAADVAVANDLLYVFGHHSLLLLKGKMPDS
jgi:hypothetical protein